MSLGEDTLVAFRSLMEDTEYDGFLSGLSMERYGDPDSEGLHNLMFTPRGDKEKAIRIGTFIYHASSSSWFFVNVKDCKYDFNLLLARAVRSAFHSHGDK